MSGWERVQGITRKGRGAKEKGSGSGLWNVAVEGERVAIWGSEFRFGNTTLQFDWDFIHHWWLELCWAEVTWMLQFGSLFKI